MYQLGNTGDRLYTFANCYNQSNGRLRRNVAERLKVLRWQLDYKKYEGKIWCIL